MRFIKQKSDQYNILDDALDQTNVEFLNSFFGQQSARQKKQPDYIVEVLYKRLEKAYKKGPGNFFNELYKVTDQVKHSTEPKINPKEPKEITTDPIVLKARANKEKIFAKLKRITVEEGPHSLYDVETDQILYFKTIKALYTFLGCRSSRVYNYSENQTFYKKKYFINIKKPYK